MSSGVRLPVSMPATSGWQILDWITVSGRTQPAAGGLATLELQQLDGDERWLVDHAVIACTSALATSLRLYATSVAPANLLDGSRVGNFDVADWPAGLVVHPSTSLVAQWTGATDGAIGTLNLQARLLRRR